MEKNSIVHNTLLPIARDVLYRVGLLDRVRKWRSQSQPPTIRYGGQDFESLNPMVVRPHWTVDPQIKTASLNVLLPALDMRLMSGGPNTVINLACRVSKLGTAVRFFCLERPLTTAPEELFRHFAKVSEGNLDQKLISFHDASHAGKQIPIGRGDYFLASAWWTVQSIKDFCRQQNKPFFYMIQDYEPGFYSWGLRHAMALESYDQPHIPIFNSSQLRDYFMIGKESLSQNGFSFVPSIDRSEFYFEPNADRSQKRLLFYARPSIAPRNLYELGLQALYECSKEGLFQGWKLNFMGEKTAHVKFDSGVSITCLPWMDYQSYAKLLRSSDIVLSLMLSPHPSYTPLEAAAAGCIVVTNSYETKTTESLEGISKNLICSTPYLENLKAAIRKAVADSANLDQRRLNSQLNLPKSWSEAFGEIPQQISTTVSQR